MPPGFPKGQQTVHDREGDRRARRSRRSRLDGSRARGSRSTRTTRRHGTHVAGIAAGNAEHGRASRTRRLRRRPARVHRELQGLRRDRLGPEPERELAGDRRRDRGRRRRRDGRHQLLGRRARDRAEPRHRRARARRRGSSRRRAGHRRRERLRGRRRRLGLVAGELARARSPSAPSRSSGTPPKSVARRLLVGRADDDLAAPQAGRRRARSRRPLVRLRRRLGRRSRARAWLRRTSPAPRRSSPAPSDLDGGSGQVRTRPDRDRLDRRDVAARSGPQFQGGGVVALATGRSTASLRRADRACRSGSSREDSTRRRARSSLDDAGGGAGTWQVDAGSNARRHGRASLRLPSDGRRCPESSTYELVVPRGAAPGDLAGYIELRRGADVRRIPFLGRVTVAALAAARARCALTAPGVYTRHDARASAAFVSRYRYPDNPSGIGVTTVLRGPERVYRVRICEARRELRRRRSPDAARGSQRRAARRRRPGREPAHRIRRPSVRTQPVPRRRFCSRVLAAGALSPAPGEYAVVFDSATRERRGLVHVPLLGERRDAADAPTPDALGRARAGR